MNASSSSVTTTAAAAASGSDGSIAVYQFSSAVDSKKINHDVLEFNFFI
tara:strand:+ start:156 stop:302 length:147 start_codon:yes stop_codon:yes gene_type:complete